MFYFFRSLSITAIALTISISALNCYPSLANGGNNPKQYAKYLNPFQKQGYLNQSQDRIIKKKAFKADMMPDLGAQPVINRELGLFAILPADKFTDPELAETLLKDPRINGLSATIPWSMLEPKEDELNWQPIDRLLSLCKQNNKTLILRISTCGVDLQSESGGKATTPDTPSWVFEGETRAKSVAFSDASGKEHLMPLFWDKAYLAHWSNFVKELAARYDNNPDIHSIGITGGGFNGGTSVVPEYKAVVSNPVEKKGAIDLEDALKINYGMTPRQLVEHWKYAADIFPKRFQHARLNFAINAPVPHRWGEDALDEISDYLVYRYGSRVYITRQGLANGKHGFDDYRVLLKFRNDTLSGLQLADNVKLEDMPKLVKHALDDGISFAELPVSVLNSNDDTVKAALTDFSAHIGYQLIYQKAALQDRIAVGQPLQANFTFTNAGAAPAIRPERFFDKDAPGSYRVQIELRDAQGKPVLQNVHTPPTPTSAWAPGKPVEWQQELKMVDADKHQLPAGQYTAWMSLVDTDAKRKIAFVDATSGKATASANAVKVGEVSIVAGPPVETKKLEATNQTSIPQGRHQ